MIARRVARRVARRIVAQLRPSPSAADVEAIEAAFYASPEVVAAYAASVDDGLWPVERRLADRFLRAGDRLLDVGCGGGREALGLSRRGVVVVGIDRCAAAVEVARRRVDGVRFEARSLAAFAAAAAADAGPERAAERFDVVFFASDVVASVPGRSNRVAMLRRARALVRRGGLVMFQADVARGAKRYVLDPLRAALARVGVDVAEPGDRSGDRARDGDGTSSVARPTFRHLFPSEAALDAELGSAGLVREARVEAYLVARR